MFAKRRKKDRSKFKPDHSFIAEAVEDFLKSGGKITKVVLTEDMFKQFIQSPEYAANDFFTEGL